MSEPTEQTEHLIEALMLVEKTGTITAAAEAAGVPRSTMRDRYHRAKQLGLDSTEQQLERIEHDENYETIRTVGPRIKTVEDALKHAGVDLDVWEPGKVRVNSWPTSMKVKTSDGEKVTQITNFQVSVDLRRKAPKFVQDAIQALVPDDFRSPVHGFSTPVGAEYLLMLSLYDVHLGKLCWAKETGTDYDLDLAAELFTSSINRLLGKVTGFPIEKICLPIGNDFFQANNWQSETAKGTRVDSVDDRMSRVFRTALKMLVWTIEECRRVAPVKLVWIPGNHDPETSWYLITALKCWFRDCADVEIDDGPSWRKYLSYGVNFIGLTHGNEEKPKDLPLIMATERPEEWSAAKCREWHIGHLHTKREMRFTTIDEFNGVVVRWMPSLSGTDSWHFRKGYVQNNRAAEALLYSRQTGFDGQFTASVLHGG